MGVSVSRCMRMGKFGCVSAWVQWCMGLFLVYGCVGVGVPVHACASGWVYGYMGVRVSLCIVDRCVCVCLSAWAHGCMMLVWVYRCMRVPVRVGVWVCGCLGVWVGGCRGIWVSVRSSGSVRVLGSQLELKPWLVRG